MASANVDDTMVSTCFCNFAIAQLLQKQSKLASIKLAAAGSAVS